MPLYDFKCSMCGHIAERFRIVSEASDPEQCPVCQYWMDRVYSANFAPAGLTSRKCPKGCVELGNEYEAVRKLRPVQKELINDRDVQEWSRTTTEFQGLPD